MRKLPKCCITRAAYYESKGMKPEDARVCAVTEHKHDAYLKKLERKCRKHNV